MNKNNYEKKLINWISNKTINNTRINKLLEDSIKTGRFSNNGPNVILLEKIIKLKLQIADDKDIIVVNNGTSALHSMILAIEFKLKRKLKWATQSFTFPPSNQGPLSNSLIVDIDNEGGIDLNKITGEIDGIIITNVFGNIVNISKYEKWCKDNNKILVFDNAATPFTFFNKKSSCNYGLGSIISFHHTKSIGFGEGGAIIIDKEYGAIVRGINNFGMGLTENYYLPQGNNFKMSDVSAAYIIQYLDNFDKIVEKHKLLYKYIKIKITEFNILTRKKLKAKAYFNTKNGKTILDNRIDLIKLFPSFHDEDKILPNCICLLIEKNSQNIIDTLLENNIFSRKYYHPLKNTEIANDIYSKIVCFPCNIDMSLETIDNILKIIFEILLNP